MSRGGRPKLRLDRASLDAGIRDRELGGAPPTPDAAFTSLDELSSSSSTLTAARRFLPLQSSVAKMLHRGSAQLELAGEGPNVGPFPAALKAALSDPEVPGWPA
jgi:hypothetical protein